jgi:hypothetical protein
MDLCLLLLLLFSKKRKGGEGDDMVSRQVYYERTATVLAPFFASELARGAQIRDVELLGDVVRIAK